MLIHHNLSTYCQKNTKRYFLRGDTGRAVAIDIAVVPFPDVGLPPGVESDTAVTSEEERGKLFQAIQRLSEPFDRFMAEGRPDAVVADGLLTWSVDAAAEHGVPRLVFFGTSVFARSCTDSMLRNNPKRPGHWGFFQTMNAADQRSYGEVFNSFHELEPDTLSRFSPAEMRELARGLDLSGKNFVWVIKGVADIDAPKWMPKGFASLISPCSEYGLTVWGWAPQMLILNHPAVDGFVTHCG
ncbi:hypothetical protein E2562_008112 [Oryza meyeriana var. granulata]|uniref:Uncharacterized protein n=1 Tax=Oryza meyeriana var. granulata TaxID=110450 RepID=A0A6G1CEN1_9ORYZ|nr:hypothetical protein E2562_008112 [Oryza meyeriana var. granulata]